MPTAPLLSGEGNIPETPPTEPVETHNDACSPTPDTPTLLSLGGGGLEASNSILLEEGAAKNVLETSTGPDLVLLDKEMEEDDGSSDESLKVD
ncbi:hypothetical protein GWI33_000680 [Rhynchophorus ferrugineus]|uniref:Uncharacterized protein n=1 Tax=Rhynchophorus ferrugineus TaxID=354439 RepID=A0A834MGS0_RHYFE|nr:hypothetical protein GWI33_000680 [Rhynchophorus ferrugineus]